MGGVMVVLVVKCGIMWCCSGVVVVKCGGVVV
jgi:hypothetical protein